MAPEVGLGLRKELTINKLHHKSLLGKGNPFEREEVFFLILGPVLSPVLYLPSTRRSAADTRTA